jgi:potassium-transporting ATPase potassium-binding subunit
VGVDTVLRGLLFLVALTLASKPLGVYVYRVMEGVPTYAERLLGPVERSIYRWCRVDSRAEMNWKEYFTALLIFNAVGAVFLYLLLRLQAILPLNPAHLGAVSADSAFNTAVSFATNTSWQDYAGETALGNLVQMVGISPQSFLSAATGIAALMALLRGFARIGANTLGNVWVDLTRVTIYLLLPLSALIAVLLISQGAIQTLSANRVVALLDPSTHELATHIQTLPLGPVASQTAIALLSGDGGGFYGANSAHPYANPTALSNFAQMLAILLIPAALCHTFGKAVGDKRQGWAIFAVMLVVFVLMSTIAIQSEQSHAGGNMEGKETRFGIVDSALFATVTTSGGDGAVNSMHDSFTPIGGLVPMVLMQLGEVIFGGPGSGLYGMLLHAMIAVFIAALMIGRSPEYLGKKIEIFEMKMLAVAVLVTPFLVLVGTAAAVLSVAGRSGASNPGAHGFSQILYAFSSVANNNGSAFAGLAANTAFYNISTAVAMWFGRFVPLLAVLAIAGSLAAKKRRAPGLGTLPTHNLQFMVVLLGTVLVVGSLTYVPALALGPIIESLQMADLTTLIPRQ